MAVTMVKIHDRQQRILSPQTRSDRNYPLLSSGTTTELHGADLIERWVRIITRTRVPNLTPDRQ